MNRELDVIKNFVNNKLKKIDHLDLEYVFLAGSSLYGADKVTSDIDLNFVFNDNFFENKELAITKIKALIKSIYLPLHKKLQRRPDTIYPGEYISVSQIIASIEGAGFSVSDDKLTMVNTTSDYWETNERTWYRAWFGAIAFSQEISTGSTKYIKHKSIAQAGCIVYLISNHKDLIEKFTINEIINRMYNYNDKKKSPFGLTKTYTKFKQLHIQSITNTIEMNNKLFKKTGNGSYMVDISELAKKTQQLILFSNNFNVNLIPTNSRLSREETYKLSLSHEL
jgi:hypothetical protein